MTASSRWLRRAASAVLLAAVAAAWAWAPAAAEQLGPLWPVDGVPIKITGGMGERRADHPHAGIDISLYGKAGVAPIVSVGGGRLTRLRSSKHGYGNALYIFMGGGQLALYAHLDRFSPRLERLAAEIRERTGRQTVDYTFAEGEPTVEVARGEIIGYGGKSGTVTPHLHFELRGGETEALNPLVFGLNAPDEISPTIAGVRFVPLDDEARVDGRAAAYELNYAAPPRPAGAKKRGARAKKTAASAGAAAMRQAPLAVRGRVGLAVDAYDRQLADGPYLPPHRIETVVDGRTLFAVTYNGWDWRDRRLWMIQYEPNGQGRRRWWRAYNPYPVEIPFFSAPNGGTLDALEPGEHKLEIVVDDAKGNTSVVEQVLRVEGVSRPARPVAAPAGALFNDQTLELVPGRFSLVAGRYSLLAPAKLTATPVAAAMPGALACYAVSDPGVPMRRGLGARFAYAASEAHPERLGVYRVDPAGPLRLETTFDANARTVTGDSVEYGTFCLARDDAPPEIEQARVFNGGRKITFLVSDALSGMDVEGLQVWAGEQRAIVSFSPRSGQAAAHVPDGALDREIVIIAVDRTGNAARLVVRP